MSGFDKWYRDRAIRLRLSLNPDDPAHHYDYRAAYRAGAEPDKSGHWPSRFKAPDHPNRYVDGIDTITGEPVRDTEEFKIPDAGYQQPPSQAEFSYRRYANQRKRLLK